MSVRRISRHDLPSDTACGEQVLMALLQIVSVAQAETPYIYKSSFAEKRNPNRRQRWLIPFAIAGQIALKVGSFGIHTCQGLHHAAYRDFSALSSACIVQYKQLQL